MSNQLSTHPLKLHLDDYLALFDAMPDMVLMVWQNAPGWPIVSVSSNAELVLGYTQGSLLGLDGGYRSLIHKQDLSRVDQEVEQATAQGLDAVKHKHYRVYGASGTPIWLSDTTRIYFGDDGHPQYFVGSLQNITAEKKLTEALEEKSTRLELVLEGTRLGMWDWNPQTNDVVFNERWANMLGYKLDEIEHSLSSWESKVHPDDIAGCFADITAHMEGKVDFYENIHRMRHKDGTWRYILDRGRIVEWDEGGNPTRFTGTHTDITEQKQKELEAKQAAEAKGQFLANMSHEIRTPLHGMLGLLSVLNRDALSQKDQQLLSTVENSAELLKSIINDILDYSKLDADQLKLRDEPFDVAALVTDCQHLFDGNASKKGILLTSQIEKNVPKYFRGDSNRLKQCINNLISNAIKFTEHGQVTIEVKFNENLHVSVADTGIGIKDPSSVFGRFYQEEEVMTKVSQGTGLGLSIVKKLVDLMAGEITVTSKLGEGSCFEMILPLTELSHSVAEEETQAQDQAIESFRILVAEDNPINQMVISEMLEISGQSLDIVDNGEAAVNAYKEKPYDFIFMDLHMPIMSGKQASSILSALPNPPKVVLMSADVVSTNAIDGQVEALHKPFDIQQLHALLVRLSSRFKPV